jgi:hypothetical protein
MDNSPASKHIIVAMSNRFISAILLLPKELIIVEAAQIHPI